MVVFMCTINPKPKNGAHKASSHNTTTTIANEKNKYKYLNNLHKCILRMKKRKSSATNNNKRPILNSDNDGVGCFGLFSTASGSRPLPSSSSSTSSSSRKGKVRKTSSRYPLFKPVPLQNRPTSTCTKASKVVKDNTNKSVEIGSSKNASGKITQGVASSSVSLKEIDKIIQSKQRQRKINTDKPKQKQQQRQVAIDSFFRRDKNEAIGREGSEAQTGRTCELRCKCESKEGIQSNSKYPVEKRLNAKSPTVCFGDEKFSVEELSESKGKEEESSKALAAVVEMKEETTNRKIDTDTNDRTRSSRLKNKNNILSLLQHRSTSLPKKCISMDHGCHGMRTFVNRQWNICKSVELDSQNVITVISFDTEGILLAVGDTKGFVRIYDFDEVNAASIKVKNKRRSNSNISNIISGNNSLPGNEEAMKIKPFLMFKAGNARISAIEWDPSNQDVLAVSFFNWNEVRIFDISSMSNNRPLNICLVDANDRQSNGRCGYTVLRFMMRDNCTKKCKLLTGCFNGNLKLWQFSVLNMRSSSSKQGTLIWSINVLYEEITDIIHLPSNSKKNEREYDGLVMVATALGSFALFDTNKFVRKSFSSSKTPQQLKIWNISQYNDLKRCMPPEIDRVGVKKCLIQNNRDNVAPNAHSLQKFVDLSVCLSVGWVISMHLDLHMNNGCWEVSGPSLKVQHKPPNIQYHDSEGNKVRMQHPHVCVPELPTPVACPVESSSIVFIADVRPTDIILPAIDKRVLAGGYDRWTTRRGSGDQDHILVLDQSINSRSNDDKNILSRIPLPTGRLRQMAVHPGNQWIVLLLVKGTFAAPNSLVLMNLHDQLPIQSATTGGSLGTPEKVWWV